MGGAVSTDSKQNSDADSNPTGSTEELSLTDLNQLKDHIALKVSEIKREDEDAFFDRVDELDHLLSIVKRRPYHVTVLVGPVSCGKSTLLHKLQSTWENGAQMLKMFSPVLFVDMRGSNFNSPEAAAQEMRKLILSWADQGMRVLNLVNIDWGPVAMTKQVVTSVLSLLKNDLGDANNIATVTSVINCYVKAHSAVKPIIIIDEADRMGKWPQDERDIFIGFLKSLSKESRRAHVFMSSWDDFFRGTIQYRWSLDFFTVVGLGYLGPDDAKDFFGKILSGYDKPENTTWEDEWEGIYSVTGGSIMALNDICDKAAEADWDWDEVLNRVRASFSDLIAASLLPPEGSVWTAQQYLSVIKALVAGDGIVSIWSIYELICNQIKPITIQSSAEETKNKLVMVEKYGLDTFQQAQKAVASLLKDNRIHLRYVGSKNMYRDVKLPTGSSGVTEFIMARKPYEFAGMKHFVSGKDLSL